MMCDVFTQAVVARTTEHFRVVLIKSKKRHFPRQFLILRTREITNMVSVVEEVIIVADQIEHCRFDGVVFFSLISILAVLMHGSRFQYPV